MSEKHPECPLYNPLNCKEYYNPKLCAFVKKDKVCLKKKKPKTKHKKTKFIGKSYSDFSELAFQLEIESSDWSNVFAADNVDLAWTNFRDKFISVLNNHAPFKSLSARENPQPCPVLRSPPNR